MTDHRRDVLTRAILRAGTDHVAWPDDDPGHVYVRKIGATEILRCRLSPEAVQFLAGEFREIPAGGVGMWLLAPTRPKDR